MSEREFCHSASRRPSSSAGQFDPWPLARNCAVMARIRDRLHRFLTQCLRLQLYGSLASILPCVTVPTLILCCGSRPSHITRLRQTAAGVVQLMCHCRQYRQNSEKKKHCQQCKDISVNGCGRLWIVENVSLYNTCVNIRWVKRTTVSGPYQQRRETILSARLMAVEKVVYYGRPVGQAIIFCSCGLVSVFSSPILSRRRLSVYGILPRHDRP